MTQSTADTITVDYTTTNTNSSYINSSNLDSITTTISGISTNTVDLSDMGYITYDNIKIVPTLWTEALPDVYTVNDMCKEYPALAKVYENFKTVYKLIEQDYKGKKKDD
jgi:hypothetical protein